MEVVQSRAAFVTGQEVLEHLLALKPELDIIKAAHDDRRLRFRQMKDDGVKLEPEERERTWGGRNPQDGLGSIVDETIKHLSREELPFVKQSSSGNAVLSKALQAMRKFTKLEILQIVDLSPRTEVELYVIIEELHTRLTAEEIDETLALVKSMLVKGTVPVPAGRPAPNGFGTMEGEEDDLEEDYGPDDTQDWEENAEGAEDMGYEQDEERDEE